MSLFTRKDLNDFFPQRHTPNPDIAREDAKKALNSIDLQLSRLRHAKNALIEAYGSDAEIVWLRRERELVRLAERQAYDEQEAEEKAFAAQQAEKKAEAEKLREAKVAAMRAADAAAQAKAAPAPAPAPAPSLKPVTKTKKITKKRKGKGR